MKEYDIILVYYFVRKHDYYAHIINGLSKQYKIAILLSDEENFYEVHRGIGKVKNTDKLFRSLCVKLGAELVYINRPLKAKLVVLPNYIDTYTEHYKELFCKNVKWDELIALLPIFCHPTGFEFLKKLNPSLYMAPAKYILEMKMKKENTYNLIENLNMVEMGFPHKKYSIFDDAKFDIDYIVAYPSHTHFLESKKKEKEKYDFISTLYKLLGKISDKDKVVLKHHNNRDTQRYFSSSSFKFKNNLILRSLIVLNDFLIKISPFKYKLYLIGRKLKSIFIESKYPSFETITEYNNLGLESFLPYIRKGLITGISSTHLHALKNRLPVYNCDPQQDDEVTEEYHKKYLVDCCNGELFFDEKNYDRVPKELSNADVVELLKSRLNRLGK
ncbi:MAG: hypothetical protein ACD_79C00145G0002 [uncultured bacterium]|nr:MAG: hypothetical protein ACD_79C00145G0002 [uncultured bacterium]